MHTSRFFPAFLLLCVMLAAVSLPAADFETPGVWKASSLLSDTLRTGPGFKVEETVHSDGFMYLFTMRSDYGVYKASGLEDLKDREYELHVLNALQQFTDSKVFTKAAKEAGIDLVTAPVRLVENVAGAVADPKKTLDTLSKVPSGVVSLFSDVYDQARSGVKTAAKAVSGGSSADRKEAGDAALGKGTEVALRYIGYSKRENEWYQKYELDPYTTNRPLRDKISRIVSVQSAVNFGFKFVPGISLGGLGWLGTVDSVLDKAEQVAVYADPQQQGEKDRAALAGMGIAPAAVEAFMKSGAFSPTVRALYVGALKKLSGVEGRGRWLELMAKVKTSEGAEFHLRGVRYLAKVHVQGQPLTRALAGVPMPAALSRAGKGVAPLAVDYLIWSRDFADDAEKLTAAVKEAGGVSGVEAVLYGKASPRCRSELAAHGIAVREGTEL